MEDLIPQVGRLVGIDPTTFLFYMAVLSMAANVIARLIPNDATGWKGGLRKVCTIIGVYVSSRVSPGVTVNDVAKAAIETPAISEKVDAPTVPAQFDDILAALKDPESPLSVAINRATSK